MTKSNQHTSEKNVEYQAMDEFQKEINTLLEDTAISQENKQLGQHTANMVQRIMPAVVDAEQMDVDKALKWSERLYQLGDALGKMTGQAEQDLGLTKRPKDAQQWTDKVQFSSNNLQHER